jgi:hypothetical protein
MRLTENRFLAHNLGWSLLLLAASSVLVTGCGLGVSSPISASLPPITSNPGTHAGGGSVFGGQQPVAGAAIALYAAGTTGYGTGAQLLTSGVAPTAADGSFTIDGTYDLAACQNANDLVYAVATGGNSGFGSGSNPAIAMMAAIGPCSQLSSSSYIQINEVTTVAAVAALSKFMSATYGTAGAFSIGTTGTNITGLTNAFATAANLADISQGTAPGATLPLGATVPAATIYSLADILATCVNSDGTTCPANLFSAVKPSTQPQAPADTIQAALDIFQNPTNNVSGTFSLAQATGAPFPGLAAAPNDWSLQIVYTGRVTTGTAGTTNGFLDPYFPAVDSKGNVWVLNNPIANHVNPISTTNPADFIEVLSPNGTPIVGATDLADTAQFPTFSFPHGFELDTNDVGWVPNYGTILAADNSPANANVVFKIPMAGAPTTIQAVAPLNGNPAPESLIGLSVDGSNNVWFGSNTLRQVTYVPAGTTMAAPPPNSTSNNAMDASPVSIAVDTVGNIWTTSTGTSASPPNKAGLTYIVNPLGSTHAGKTTIQTYGDYLIPDGLVVDANNNAWISVYVMSGGTGNSTIQQYSGNATNSTITLLQTCQGGNLQAPRFIVLDGDGNIWATNINAAGALIGFSSTCAVLTGPSGLGAATLTQASLIDGARKPVVDGSGNIWLANDQPTETTMVEFVGVAAPTITPIAQALASQKVGTRP